MQLTFTDPIAAQGEAIGVPKEPTQAERLLAILRRHPVCSYSFYQHPHLTHRIGARIYDLRRQGHTITSAPCDGSCGINHRTRAVVYTLNE